MAPTTSSSIYVDRQGPLNVEPNEMNKDKLMMESHGSFKKLSARSKYSLASLSYCDSLSELGSFRETHESDIPDTVLFLDNDDAAPYDVNGQNNKQVVQRKNFKIFYAFLFLVATITAIMCVKIDVFPIIASTPNKGHGASSSDIGDSIVDDNHSLYDKTLGRVVIDIDILPHPRTQTRSNKWSAFVTRFKETKELIRPTTRKVIQKLRVVEKVDQIKEHFTAYPEQVGATILFLMLL